MSLVTRAVTAFAVLAAAAIPVAALTIKNTSGKDISIAVDNGTDEAVYQVPAGGAVDVREDCSADCAVTGPWGYSRLVPENATIETDGASLVTAAAPPTPRLVPQDPAAEPADAVAAPSSVAETPAAEPEVQARPKRAAKARKPVRQAKKGPAPGTFQMLFQGPGK